MSRLAKFWSLSGAEKRIFLRAILVLPVVSLKLRLFGFKETLSRLQQSPLAEQPINIELPAHAEQLSKLVNGAARLLFRREACLERAIVLCSLLRRRGVEGELRIGVATDNDRMRAHAWVEIGGEPINEEPRLNERFNAFDSSFAPEYRDFL